MGDAGIVWMPSSQPHFADTAANVYATLSRMAALLKGNRENSGFRYHRQQIIFI